MINYLTTEVIVRNTYNLISVIGLSIASNLVVTRRLNIA